MVRQPARARALRHRATEAERLLWFRLRNRRLAGFKFRRQEPVGGRIVDFLCAEKKLTVELDGSGHAYPIHQLGDTERTIELHENGIRVIQFWNSAGLQDLDWVLDTILLKLDSEKSRWARVDPHLSPLPKGEEDARMTSRSLTMNRQCAANFSN